MSIKNVVVFGATGVQGRAQLRDLVSQGYGASAAVRNPDALVGDAYASVRRVVADYDDRASLDAAVAGNDAVFFQAPALGDNARLLVHCASLGEAIRASSVKLVVINSSMWAPAAPCGEIIYDGVLAMEEVFLQAGLPVIIFQPTLFMNNLTGDWVRGSLVDHGLYHYPHQAELRSDWIALEDVAKFMVAALDHPELAGRRFRIGGPERLTTLDMLEIIGRTIGRDIAHQYMTPAEFGEFFWNFYGAASGLDRDVYVAGWDSFYTFNNQAPAQPFQADSSEALRHFPVERLTLAQWAANQQWRL